MAYAVLVNKFQEILDETQLQIIQDVAKVCLSILFLYLFTPFSSRLTL